MPGSFIEPTIGFQLWLNLKLADKYGEASYQEQKAEKLPSLEKPGLKAKIIVGNYENIVSPIKGKTEFEFFDFQLAPNSLLTIPAKKNWSTFLVVYKGG